MAKRQIKVGDYKRVPANFPLREYRKHLVCVIKIEGDRLTCRSGSRTFTCTADELGAARGLTVQQRWDILNRDRFRCRLCGQRPKPGVELQVDHAKSFDDGGTTEIDNLWTLCSECNQGKGSQSIEIELGGPRVSTTELNDAWDVLADYRDHIKDERFLKALEVVERAFDELHGK